MAVGTIRPAWRFLHRTGWGALRRHPGHALLDALDAHPRAIIILAAAALAALFGSSCSRQVRMVQAAQPAVIAELWQAPAEPRDLFRGPGGEALMPQGSSFAFVAEDVTGHSPGFDVRDSQGTEWSVKTGPEAQTEVVTSRILWAMGFHQPPTYYLDRWSLTGGRTGTQEPGRFRPDVKGREVVGDWPWHENPFVGTTEFGGLIVANVLLTNWDWKASNNKIYQMDTPVGGVRRWFLVRDLGASLGTFTYPTILKWFRLRGFGQGTRNDLPGFEQQGFIDRIEGDKVHFHYKGIYRDVISTVTPEHVRWACDTLSSLTDQQWKDAFRAGGYNADQTARWVKKIKEKIAQGLQLTSQAR